MGFRSPEISVDKDQNVFRIVCMGDSSTFGSGVYCEDTYPRVLERLLNNRYGEKKFETVNTGYTGYSSFQGLILLQQSVLKLHPDIITISYGICDNASPHGKVILTDKEFYDFNISFKGRMRELLLHSKIYILLEKGIVASVNWFKTGEANAGRDFFEQNIDVDNNRAKIKTS